MNEPAAAIKHDGQCEIESGAVGYDGLYCNCADRAAASAANARKYRKLPVVIEAIQLNESLTLGDLIKFFGCEPDNEHNMYENRKFRWGSVGDGKIYVETLEGTMTVAEDDWIIRGVNGEFYPCKPDIFEKTYEPIEVDE